MKYCTVDDIKKVQKSVAIKTDDGTWGPAKVLGDDDEHDITRFMPDNIKISFWEFCDGCNFSEPQVTLFTSEMDRDVFLFSCKRINSCVDLNRRFVENAE